MSGTTDGGDGQNVQVTAEQLTALQSTLDAAVAERDELKKQLRDTKSSNKDTDKIAKERDELMQKLDKLSSDFDGFRSKVRGEKTSGAIQTALETAGAHNVARVAAMLDVSKLKVAEDGTPDQSALKAEIEALKTSDAYLFKTEQTTTSTTLPGISKPVQKTQSDGFKEALEEAKKAKDPFKAIQEVLEKRNKGLL